MKKIISLAFVSLIGLFGCSSQDNESIDYGLLGFENLNQSLELKTQWDREDGVLDPFSNLDIEILKKTNTYSYQFLGDNYKYYYSCDISENAGFYYADVMKADGKYRVRFFDHLTEPYNSYSSSPSAFIDGIESNGTFSYALRKTNSPLDIQKEYYALFYCIYHDDSFPYRVYFDSMSIYFISKDKKFDQSCGNILDNDSKIHLFKA